MTLISVITVNLNNKAGLLKTINSVQEQHSDQLEHIVVDGASIDGSVELLQEIKATSFTWSSEKDKGIYDAQNKGVLKAKGKYTLFLNSGDVFASASVIREVIPQLNEKDIVYGDLITVENGNKTEHKSFDIADVSNLMLSTIWHPCAFIKRSLFESSGLYNTDFKLAGDYEFFVRTIIKDGATTWHISKFIAEFDMGGQSNFKDNQALLLAERERAWELNFTNAAIESFKKSVSLERSREYKWGKRISKFFP